MHTNIDYCIGGNIQHNQEIKKYTIKNQCGYKSITNCT